jgi:uncharacterized surface protein with fasciclin (FAS1) repeats
VQGIDQVLVPPDVDINPPPPTTSTTEVPTTVAPTTEAPTTAAPTTGAATTEAPTTAAPTTAPPTTESPTTTAAPPDGQNLYEVIAADPDFSLVLELIDYAGLQSSLETAGPGTLFVPTNGAFGATEEVGQATIDAIKRALSPDQVADLLRYSAAPGLITTDQLDPGTTIPTLLEGQTLEVVAGEVIPDILGAGNQETAIIVKPDTDASNGVVQGVDRLLLPAGIELPSQLPA